MSLDVYLEDKREACEHCGRSEESKELFSYNITHNLARMAEAAKIYEHLWRPEEIEITKASQLVEPLKSALIVMKNDPQRFKDLNPENGWGSYEGLVQCVEYYLKACEQFPYALVRASR